MPVTLASTYTLPAGSVEHLTFYVETNTDPTATAVEYCVVEEGLTPTGWAAATWAVYNPVEKRTYVETPTIGRTGSGASVIVTDGKNYDVYARFLALSETPVRHVVTLAVR